MQFFIHILFIQFIFILATAEDNAPQTTMVVQLWVILEDHDIHKLTLPTGIPNTVEDLFSLAGKTFQLTGEFALLHKDNDFGNQFFSVTSVADLQDKATVKVIRNSDPWTTPSRYIRTVLYTEFCEFIGYPSCE